MGTRLDWHYFSSGPREAVLLKLLNSDVRIKNVYVTDPARWPKIAPTIDLAKKNGLSVHILTRRDLEKPPAELKNEMCLSVGFGIVFPKIFLDHIKLALNVHGTLLPKYRGARTLNWVIENGEVESGVSIHIIDEHIDNGPIIFQKKFSISKFDTGKSLARKTLLFEPEVVLEAVKKFEKSGDSIAQIQKINEQDDYYPPNRIRSHSELNPAHSLQDLYNKIRASDPEQYPAHFYIDGQKVCVKLWRENKPDSEFDLI